MSLRNRSHAGAIVLLSLAITMLGRAPWAAAATSNVHIRNVDTTSSQRVELTIALGKAAEIKSTNVKAPEPAPVRQPVEQPEASLVDRLSVSGLLLYTFLATFLLALAAGAWTVRTRAIREFASRVRITQVGPDLPEHSVKSMMGWVPDALVHAAEAMAHSAGFTANLEKKLERAGAPIRVGEFVVGSALAALGGAIVAMSLLPIVLFSLLMAGVAAWVPSIALAIAARRRTDKLHGQLADVLTILASSLRAGHSFMQALDMVAKEIGEPAAHEFGRVVAETRLGRPINEAMDALAERIGSEDFRWALLAVNIQREVGGNLAEILDTVADTMRERDTIRRQIGVLTAEGRLSIAILTGLPIGLALYMAKVNPSYIGLLFSTKLGVLMTFTGCCLLVVGVMWMRKVVKIDV
jgi:tight adherence protein B